MFEPGLARWMMKKSKEKLKNVSNTLLLESTRNTGWLSLGWVMNYLLLGKKIWMKS